MVAVEAAESDKCAAYNWCEDCITAMSQCAWCRDEVSFYLFTILISYFIFTNISERVLLLRSMSKMA